VLITLTTTTVIFSRRGPIKNFKSAVLLTFLRLLLFYFLLALCGSWIWLMIATEPLPLDRVR
jgi:hypothetical protein